MEEGSKAQEATELVFEGELIGPRLLDLLLQCTEFIAMDNLNDTSVLLLKIVELSLPFGTSPEQVGTYFIHVLQVCMISSCLGTYLPPTAKSPTLNQS